MPGGRGMMRPEDNPKPFTKDYNMKDFVKWTEERVHSLLGELEEWLLEEIEVKDKGGNIIRTEDAGNCFFKGFIYKKGLFDDWITYVKNRYESVKIRLDRINKIQEYKLQFLSANGIQREQITKFILANKFNWREKSDNKNENKNSTIIWKEDRVSKSKSGDDIDFDDLDLDDI